MHVLSALLDDGSEIWLDFPEVDIKAIRYAARPSDVVETTSSDAPTAVLANSVKRILAYAMEEQFRARREVVDFLQVNEFVEPEFILLGLLREVESDAAKLLTTNGLTLEKGRSCLSGPRDSW